MSDFFGFACCPPPDGRGEVCVDGRGEAVVVEVAVHARAEVHGLHHAACGQDAQQRVEVREAVHLGHVQGVRQGLGRVRVDVQTLRNRQTPGQVTVWLAPTLTGERHPRTESNILIWYKNGFSHQTVSRCGNPKQDIYYSFTHSFWSYCRQSRIFHGFFLCANHHSARRQQGA